MFQKFALELAQGKFQGVAVRRGVLMHLLQYTEKHQLLLLSLVLSITSRLFATLTLHWARRHIQLPQDLDPLRNPTHTCSSLFRCIPKYSMHRAVAMTVTILHLSVVLFLVGPVLFFFTINKTVVIVVSIAVWIFGIVYLTLTIVACIDRDYPYRTPISGVWWSQRISCAPLGVPSFLFRRPFAFLFLTLFVLFMYMTY
ncbi:hypothetical protein BJV74DRAFT_145859 [Russula compacta]|nr:hypothetical protein BJV74DRAFT_145859 [Russula compacta]